MKINGECVKVDICEVRTARKHLFRVLVGNGKNIVEVYETGEIYFYRGFTWYKDDQVLNKESKPDGLTWNKYISEYADMYYNLLKHFE